MVTHGTSLIENYRMQIHATNFGKRRNRLTYIMRKEQKTHELLKQFASRTLDQHSQHMTSISMQKHDTMHAIFAYKQDIEHYDPKTHMYASIVDEAETIAYAIEYAVIDHKTR